MRKIIPLLTALAALCAAGAASATTVTLDWKMPTTYTDGTAIPSTETITTTIFAGASGAETQLVAGVSGLTWTSGQEPANTKVCFYITATDVQQGTTSSATNEVCAQIPAETPDAPTNLTLKLN
jgi:hypothetical protein